MAGRLFINHELFDVFDTFSWHVMGGNSRVLWACRGKIDGCISYLIPDLFGSKYEMSLFCDETSMRRILLESGGCPVMDIFVIIAQDSGLCLLYRYSDLPVLGLQEHPFLTDGEFVPWSLEQIFDALYAALKERDNCVGTAVATVLNLMISEGTFTSASIGRVINITWRDYVGFLSEYVVSVGFVFGSELMHKFDTRRVLELLDSGYLLVAQLEQGVPYDVKPGVFESLPHRHLVIMARVCEDVVVIDAAGVRVFSDYEVERVFKGFEVSCYDGCMIVGIRHEE